MDYRRDHLLNVRVQHQHNYFYFLHENTVLFKIPETRSDSYNSLQFVLVTTLICWFMLIQYINFVTNT